MRNTEEMLYTEERGSLEGPHEEAQIQRKALKQEKSYAFSANISLEKKKGQMRMTQRKVLVGLKWKVELNKS